MRFSSAILTSLTPAPSEVIYLCEAVNRYFRDAVTPDELVWSFSGVRSLYDDGADKPEDVTRDYVLKLDAPFRAAPLLTVYGGKITTHRRLAEAALARLPYFEARPAWTAKSSLPGGDFPVDGFYAQVAEVLGRWPFLAEPHARRLVRAYGTRVERILGKAQSMHDLGPFFCRRPHRRRSALPGRERMGAQRRGRALAAQQAWPYRHARGTRRRLSVSWPIWSASRRADGFRMITAASMQLPRQFYSTAIPLCLYRPGCSFDGCWGADVDRRKKSRRAICRHQSAGGRRRILYAQGGAHAALSIGVRNIYEAQDGPTGLEAIRTVAPDVVIVDWEMPGLDGAAFVRMVRSPETFPLPRRSDHHAHRPRRALARGGGRVDRHQRIPAQAGIVEVAAGPLGGGADQAAALREDRQLLRAGAAQHGDIHADTDESIVKLVLVN